MHIFFIVKKKEVHLELTRSQKKGIVWPNKQTKKGGYFGLKKGKQNQKIGRGDFIFYVIISKGDAIPVFHHFPNPTHKERERRREEEEREQEGQLERLVF